MQSTAKGMQIKVMRVLQKNASNAKVMQKMQSNDLLKSNENNEDKCKSYCVH
jgi:hypothetical protein